MKKMIALLLCFCLILPILAACGNGAEDTLGNSTLEAESSSKKSGENPNKGNNTKENNTKENNTAESNLAGHPGGVHTYDLNTPYLDETGINSTTGKRFHRWKVKCDFCAHEAEAEKVCNRQSSSVCNGFCFSVS